MELVPLLALVVLVCASFWALWSNPRRRRKLPPGPYGYPIVGNLLQLGENPQRSLANLSKTYGPLMYLKLGSRDTVVVSSPEIAKQALKKHDHVLSGRPIPAALEAYDHHSNSVGVLPAGAQWKKLRKICKEHMFSAQALDASRGLRREKLRQLCDYVEKCSKLGFAVDISQAIFITSLNLFTAMLFSSDIAGVDYAAPQELFRTVKSMIRLIGTPNLADFFPLLKRIDPQGLRREAEVHIGKLLNLIEGIIDRRLDLPVDSPKKHDLLEVLLDLRTRNGYEMSLKDIKHLILDLIIAGQDSTSTTVEWAMTELLLNPEKMAIVRGELKTAIGEDKPVEESDISKLPYLQAVIKETFRYHPAGPLSIPRKAEDDVEINGFTIPKNSQMLVNIWGMGRDPSIWADPTSFEPERFLNSNVSFKGEGFTLIPFGSGRRMCPAMPLVDRMIPLALASLIRGFDWKLEPGNRLEDIDMSEKFGMSLKKAVPLKAIPVKW